MVLINRCKDNVISAQCLECQSEEIQVLKHGLTAGVTMTLLR